MKIVLIMPRSVLYQRDRGFKKNLRYSPLTLTTLAALIPEGMNKDIRIIDEGVEQVDYGKLEADLAGITCITGTSTRAYMIADILRGKNIKVVLGGPHPTLMPDEAKLHADSVVIGLANRSWPKLLDDLSKGKMEEF